MNIITVKTKDETLSDLARAKNPRVKNWFGFRNSGTVRRCYCYVCDALIDTESANYKQTVHMLRSIKSHFDSHF